MSKQDRRFRTACMTLTPESVHKTLELGPLLVVYNRKAARPGDRVRFGVHSPDGTKVMKRVVVCGVWKVDGGYLHCLTMDGGGE